METWLSDNFSWIVIAWFTIFVVIAIFQVSLRGSEEPLIVRIMYVLLPKFDPRRGAFPPITLRYILGTVAILVVILTTIYILQEPKSQGDAGVIANQRH